jgi:3-hydroxyethyl bacteriochlorophyllide a dehydrogenase
MMQRQASAVMFARAGEVDMATLAVSEPARGEVQVLTELSVVSAGTEGWMLKDEFTWTATPFPCVPGYQRVGMITALGSGVSGWEIGERVVATASRWQGTPMPHVGAHVSLANTAVAEVYKVSEGLDAVDAAAAVVAQVGWNAAGRATIVPGDWVVVYGDGLIGQLAAQAARVRGARVVLVGRREERMRLAAEHSADHVVDGRDPDLVERIRSQVDGRTVAAVLDSVQSESAQRVYVDLLERGRGEIVYCGFTPGSAWADMGLLQQRELTAHFVSGWARERMESTLAQLARQRLRVRPLVTHLVAADRAPEMYRMILNRSEPHLGVALDWSGPASSL